MEVSADEMWEPVLEWICDGAQSMKMHPADADLLIKYLISYVKYVKDKTRVLLKKLERDSLEQA